MGLGVILLTAACAEADPVTADPTTTPPVVDTTVSPDGSGVPVTTLPGSADTTAPPGGPDATPPPDSAGPVFVDSTEIVLLESFPVQARLVVRGSLPTPCHEPGWVVEDRGGVVEVTLWSETDPVVNCIQVLEPVELSIPLGSFESAAIAVLLNGEQVGRLEIGAAPDAGDASLVGAGWSFGMCGGYCNADLVIDGEQLVLTGWNRITDEALYVNRGALTPAALERIDAELGRLGGLELDPVYGCPDCADGGAAYLVLSRDGVVSRHDTEFGRPPEVLADLEGLAMSMIDALETCASDDLVTVADACEPWQGF